MERRTLLLSQLTTFYLSTYESVLSLITRTKDRLGKASVAISTTLNFLLDVPPYCSIVVSIQKRSETEQWVRQPLSFVQCAIHCLEATSFSSPSEIMEADFERAERRRDKERKDADRARKQREEQEARARKIVEEAEKKRQAALQAQREKDARRREREEEEALSAGGVRFAAFLRPVPLANLETDKVRLPPSTLQRLIEEGAIERNSGNVLTFELALFDDKTESIVSKTHCGVLEFTAEEGVVEVPIKAVMSLCKERGESALLNWRLRVRFVAIERFEKISAKVQPLGHGFHVDGTDTANIDLKTVLERVLSKQTTITQGDWIPVRHEGRTYTLAVRELQPDYQAVLLNTDVEIDLMPSEEVMAEKERQDRLARERESRIQRAKDLAASLPAEPVSGGIEKV